MEYDEQNSFFPFFILVALFLALVPATWSLWRKKSRQGSKSTSLIERPKCNCEKCQEHVSFQAVRHHEGGRLPGKHELFVGLGWLIFAVLLYYVYTHPLDVNGNLWDPYEILGIDPSMAESAIKSHYRRLARQFHPDKVRPSDLLSKEQIDLRFHEITRAYKALTDEVTRENWLNYGNPDGRVENSILLALPAWIVSPQNNFYVLGGYIVILGILLPYLVGKWWYGSRATTKEGVLNETAALFFRSIKDKMTKDDILALICNSYELRSNKQPPKDLIKKVETVMEEVQKSSPNAFMFSSKIPRGKQNTLPLTLIYSHLYRVDMESKELKNLQISILCQMQTQLAALITISLAFAYLNPINNSIELMADIVQALPPTGVAAWEQLPNIDFKKSLELQKYSTFSKFISQNKEEQLKTLSLAKIDKNQDSCINLAQQLHPLQIEDAFFSVVGDNIVTPSSMITLFLQIRLSDEYPQMMIDTVQLKSKSLGEGDDLLKDDPSDLPKDYPTVYTHSPYFPDDAKSTWWIYIADDKSDRVIVHPNRFSTIGSKSRKIKIQFQAPPSVGICTFKLVIKSSSYSGIDVSKNMVLTISDKSKLPPEDDFEDDISEPDEDSFAGQLQNMKGGSTVKKHSENGEYESDEELDKDIVDYDDYNTDTEDEK